MIEFLEDLWHSRIHPDEDYAKNDKIYIEKMEIASNSLNKLKETLDEEQFALLSEYEELNSDFQDYSDKIIFKYGYKLGARSTMECIIDTKKTDSITPVCR